MLQEVEGRERAAEQEGLSECLMPELDALKDEGNLPHGQMGRKGILGRGTRTDSFISPFIPLFNQFLLSTWFVVRSALSRKIRMKPAVPALSSGSLSL